MKQIRTVNLSLPEGLLRRLDREAAAESRSRSELLREAGRLYIERRERWRRIYAGASARARSRGLTPKDVAPAIAASRKARGRRRAA